MKRLLKELAKNFIFLGLQVNIKPSQTLDKDELPQIDFDLYDFEIDLQVDLPSNLREVDCKVVISEPKI